MRVPNASEFQHAPSSWISRLLGWLPGVESSRLAMHSASAQTLTKAIGLTMAAVSGPIAGAAMAVYIYGNTEGLPLAARVALATGAGLTWAAIAIVGVDRTLMLATDSIGVGRRWLSAASLLLRGSLAALMASLFSEMLVEWQFAGISNEVAQHIALATSETDAVRIAQIEGVPQAKEVADALGQRASDLKRQYDSLPHSVTSALSAAARCETGLRKLERSLRASTRAGVDADRIATMQAAVITKRRTCRNRRSDAIDRKNAYLRPIAVQIAANNAAQQAAHSKLNNATAAAATRSAALDQVTREGYSSLSGRKVGFERAKELHPEIRRSALLWWLALFAAEMLPIVLKTLLLANNPPAAEARADLAEGAGRYRMRARRASIVERAFTALFERPEVQIAIADASVPSAMATEILVGHANFLEELARATTRQRDFARTYPDLAAQAYQAYATTVANALDALANQPRSAWRGGRT